ncbi:MAG: SDR family oxidoreductase [Acidimicrobiia bacterium]|nr:SDR family oxidoreductase [Acidimicrobiia bacterium]
MGESNGRRSALVTGAASGIGRVTALHFGAGGTSVCCFDRDGSGAEATAASIRDAGGEACWLAGDVSDEVDAKSAVSTALGEFGRLDVLANVAGIGHFSNTAEESVEDWTRVLGVNLTGTFLMAREALPALEEVGGAIVNVASVAGLTAHPYAAAYGASKGGVVMFTKTLALEYAPRGVRVNAICPSGVITPIAAQFSAPEGAEESLLMRIIPPTGRLIDAEEIAAAIDFLSSPAMPNMTGAVLVVDGGVTL